MQEERKLYPGIKTRYLSIINSDAKEIKGEVSILYKCLNNIEYPDLPQQIREGFSNLIERTRGNELNYSRNT